jgi:hypothetical protein
MHETAVVEMELDDRIALCDGGSVFQVRFRSTVASDSELKDATWTHGLQPPTSLQEAIPPDPDAEDTDSAALASATQPGERPP